MEAKRQSVTALFLTICAQLLFSTGGIGVRILDEGPWTILFWRSVFMSTALGGWIFIRHRKNLDGLIGTTLKNGKWVSLFIAMSLSFYVFSITRTTVADSLLIQGTAPIFIVILGWIILREPVRKISVAALFGVVAGITVIIIPSLTYGGFSGNIFGIAKALAFAAGTIAIRHRKSVNLLPSLALAALLTIIVSAPFVERFAIALPSTGRDAAGLLRTAIRDNNPVIIFEHKALYADSSEVPDDENFSIPFGKADIKREGKDVTIVATLEMVKKSFMAAEKLAEEGIEAEIVDPRTLVPLDEQPIVDSVVKTGRAVVVHESHRTGGMGAEISSVIQEQAFKYLDAPVERLGAAQCPLPFNLGLENAVVPQVDDIVAAAKKVCYRS